MRIIVKGRRIERGRKLRMKVFVMLAREKERGIHIREKKERLVDGDEERKKEEGEKRESKERRHKEILRIVQRKLCVMK